MIAVLCAAPASHPEPATVTLRGSQRTINAQVELSPQGVIVLDDETSSPKSIYAWRLVRDVLDADDQPVAHEYQRIQDIAFRAHARIARGDRIAAEPLFRELTNTLSGSGPTQAHAAEGLLECLLLKGNRTDAVSAWLDWHNASRAAPVPTEPAQEAGAAVRWFGSGLERQAPTIDPDTALCPALPPAWLDTPDLLRVISSDTWLQIATDQRSAPLASWYRAAARAESGVEPLTEESVSALPALAPEHRIVRDIVLSRHAQDPRSRAEARCSLEMTLDNDAAPLWTRVWARLAIGRSLIVEQDESDRMLGVVHLLHLPAANARTHPFLAGLALAQAAHELHQLGDSASARTLLEDLEERFPDHPARWWAPIANVPASTPDREPDP